MSIMGMIGLGSAIAASVLAGNIWSSNVGWFVWLSFLAIDASIYTTIKQVKEGK